MIGIDQTIQNLTVSVSWGSTFTPGWGRVFTAGSIILDSLIYCIYPGASGVNEASSRIHIQQEHVTRDCILSFLMTLRLDMFYINTT